jgi:hypothetical protein
MRNGEDTKMKNSFKFLAMMKTKWIKAIIIFIIDEIFFCFQQLTQFLFDYAKENLLVLKMFIRDPYYTKISRDEGMSTLSFISTAAGLLGLCMGLSFVSVFEVGYHFFNFSFDRLHKVLCWIVQNPGWGGSLSLKGPASKGFVLKSSKSMGELKGPYLKRCSA